MNSRYLYASLTAAALFCSAPDFPAQARRDPKTEETKFQIRKENGDLIVHGQIDISASGALIWEILTDYDNLETFVPHMQESRLLKEQEDGRIWLEQISRLGFLFFKKRVRLLLRVAEDPPYRIAFSLIEGDFHTYEGAWEIDPQRTSTRLHLRLRVRPAFHLPGFILSWMARASGAQCLEAVEREALERQKQPANVDETGHKD